MICLQCEDDSKDYNMFECLIKAFDRLRIEFKNTSYASAHHQMKITMAFQLYSFTTTIASRGYHIYMHTTWDNARVGQKVVVSLETDVYSKMVDPYCCKIQTKNNEQRWVTVGHIPREISRFVFFFMRDEGGSVKGQLFSTQYRPSPIPAGGLEVPLKLTFSCLRYATFEKIKNFIAQYNYDAEIAFLEDNDREENEQDASSGDDRQGGRGIVELEMDDENNAEEENSDSDEDRFGDFFSNRSDVEENEDFQGNDTGGNESSEPESSGDEEDEDVAPKKKKLKRIRISISDEDD